MSELGAVLIEMPAWVSSGIRLLVVLAVGLVAALLFATGDDVAAVG